MGKDRRYELIGVMHRHDGIKSFKEIFNFIPKTVLAKDLQKNSYGINAIIKEPWKLTRVEIAKLSTLLEIDILDLAKLVAGDKERAKKDAILKKLADRRAGRPGPGQACK